MKYQASFDELTELTGYKPGEGKRFVIELSTSKNNSRKTMDTLASVSETDGRFVTFKLFHDFSERILSSPCKRATKKAIETQHSKAIAMLSEIKAMAVAHYADKVETEATA